MLSFLPHSLRIATYQFISRARPTRIRVQSENSSEAFHEAKLSLPASAVSAHALRVLVAAVYYLLYHFTIGTYWIARCWAAGGQK